MDEKKTFDAKVDDLSHAVQVQLKEPTNDSFEALYRKSYPFLEREARKYFDAPEDVEDALQETYLKIFEHVSSLRNPDRFLPWAMSICARTCLNKLRYKKGHQSKDELRPTVSSEEQVGLDQISADELLKSVNPDAYVNASHVSETVQAVLAELPADQEACLFLWMNGMKCKDIAAELDLNESTVRSNISYAKNKVGKTLKRMQREGTFDYRQLSSDPVAAFLYLLERYFGQSLAMSPAGDVLLQSLRAAGAASAAVGGAEVAGAAVEAATAVTGFRATLQKIARDPMTAVLGLVLAVALAIGAAVAIQASTSRTPATVAESPTTTRSAAERNGEEDSAETPPPPDQGPNANDTANPTTPAPAAQAAPAANQGGGPAATTPAANAATNTVLTPEDLIRPDGTLTAYLVENSPFPLLQNELQQTNQNLFGQDSNLVSRDYEVFTSPSSLYEKDGIIYVDLTMGNLTDHNIRLNRVQYLLRNRSGETIAHGTFVPDHTMLLSPREEAQLQLVFPKGYYEPSRLPQKVVNMETQFNMTGTTERVSTDYTIQDAMKSFAIKDVAVEDDDSIYIPNLLSNSPDPSIIRHETNGAYEDFIVRVYNPNTVPIRLYRLEFVKLVNLAYDTLAEGRAVFKTPMLIPAKGSKYFKLSIPKSELKNVNLDDITNYPQAGFIYEFT